MVISGFLRLRKKRGVAVHQHGVLLRHKKGIPAQCAHKYSFKKFSRKREKRGTENAAY